MVIKWSRLLSSPSAVEVSFGKDEFLMQQSEGAGPRQNADSYNSLFVQAHLPRSSVSFPHTCILPMELEAPLGR